MAQRGFYSLFLSIFLLAGIAILAGVFYFKLFNSIFFKSTEVSQLPKKLIDGQNLEFSQKYKQSSDELQNCSNEIGKKINCSDGYVCNESRPGGLGPEEPVRSYVSGDSKCHKSCILDSDCPSRTPICIPQTIIIEDTGDGVQMCVTRDEGLKIRDKLSRDCLESMNTQYDRALKEDGQIIEEGSPPKKYKKVFNEIIVSFLSGNPREIIMKEYGLNLLRDVDVKLSGGNYVVALPKDNVIETACKLQLDGRIENVYFSHTYIPQ